MNEHGESLSRRHVRTGKREKVGDQCTKIVSIYSSEATDCGLFLCFG